MLYFSLNDHANALQHGSKGNHRSDTNIYCLVHFIQRSGEFLKKYPFLHKHPGIDASLLATYQVKKSRYCQEVRIKTKNREPCKRVRIINDRVQHGS